jgi:hypothetical protein
MLKRENHFMGRLDNICQIEEWDKNKNYKRPERDQSLFMFWYKYNHQN